LCIQTPALQTVEFENPSNLHEFELLEEIDLFDFPECFFLKDEFICIDELLN